MTMKTTFLVEIDTAGETNLPCIAQDLEEVISQYFDLEVLSVKPWKHTTLGNSPTPTDVSVQQ